jgi:hypothetical protein
VDQSDRYRELFGADMTFLRERPIAEWLEAHPGASPDACRDGWVAACEASARFVHGYRRAPWSSGEYAPKLRLREWRELVGWVGTGEYAPRVDGQAPLQQALAAWTPTHPTVDAPAFVAGWQLACRALAERTRDHTLIRGSWVIDLWLVWLQVYRTGQFARVTTGAHWPERTSIPTRVLQASLAYLASGDRRAAEEVFQRKAALSIA